MKEWVARGKEQQRRILHIRRKKLTEGKAGRTGFDGSEKGGDIRMKFNSIFEHACNRTATKVRYLGMIEDKEI